MRAAGKSEGLLKHSILLIAFTQVANVSNMLFHMVMGRNLPPAEYGVLMAMTNVILIIGTPLDAVRTSMAHFAGRASSEGRESDVRGLLNVWGRRLGLVGALLSALGMIFSPRVAVFFQLESPVPVWFTCLTIPALLMIPLMSGALQGLQSFVWMSLSGHGWFLIRLLLGYSLVRYVAPVAASGLAAQAGAMVVGAGIGLIGILLCTAKSRTDPEGFTGVGVYLARSILLVGSFAVLMNADNILLKRYFRPEEAGLYARAFTISRLVVFLPMPVAYALFPKVISAGGTSRKARWMLLGALGLAAGLIVVAAGVCMILPQVPLGLLYKDWEPTAASVRLLRAACGAMVPLGLCYILINFEMAQHRFRSTAGLLTASTLYLAGAGRWHSTPVHIAGVLGCAGALALAALIASTFSARTERQRFIRE